MSKIIYVPILIKRIFRTLRPTQQSLRKIFGVFLIALILIQELLITAAYAQDMKKAVADETLAYESIISDRENTGLSLPFLDKSGVKAILPDFDDRGIAPTAGIKEMPSVVKKLTKNSYRPNEEINVTIENGASKEFTTELIAANGVKVGLETDETIFGNTKVLTINQPASFRPGKYALSITDSQGGNSTQDFRWGVLAVNPDKSIYQPQQTANLAIAVLNEIGEMVCDSQVELQIKDPAGKMTSLSTDNGKVFVNKECVSHDFTLKPDYETNYKVGGVGTYQMLLKAQTKNGAYSITDSFEVRDNVPFDVKRISATRIYPPNTYPVTMEITANQDFEGTVTETLPASFKVGRPGQEIKTEKDEVDDLVTAQVSASQSAAQKKEPEATPTPLAPKITTPATPKVTAPTTYGVTDALEGVLGYSTRYNLTEPKTVVAGGTGTNIPQLGMPFSGPFPVSQEFGQSLVRDIHDHDLYASFGMLGHDGVDFGMPEGTPILAAEEGEIAVAGDGDYGTTVIIQHNWGRTYYGHLSGVSVKKGDKVARGAEVGKSGNTGISTGPHLHFGVRPDKDETDNGYYGKVDPGYFLGMKQKAGAVLAASTSLNEEMDIQPTSDVQVLTWKINIKKGDKITIGYDFLAPRISPQFYTLGPAVFTDTTGNTVFQEQRKWQIAADALDYKFKRGSFSKANCTATCSQAITGVGFKPKAVILEFTLQTSEGNNATTQHGVVGLGYGTMSGGTAQERAVTFSSEDGVGDVDSYTYRSATKVLVLTDGTTGAVVAAADLVSFDSDGFTISWTTNNTSAYIIHYTAVGGSDVSNAKAGTFSLTTGTGSLTVTDPGFRPDFVHFLSGFSQTADSASQAEGHLNIGFAADANKQGSISIQSDDADTVADSYRQQRTDAVITMINGSGAGAQEAVAEFTSMDSSGFTINKTTAPASAREIYYLALQGGKYDVGSFSSATSTGSQAVTKMGFRPSGVSLATDSKTTASTAVESEGILSLGGASQNTTTSAEWCSDSSGITCDTTWKTRKKITFNNNDSGQSLNKFPVLVKLNSSRIDYSKTQNSGEDIRFIDPSDSTTVLPHQIEVWNESGESLVWVQVPRIDASTQNDFIYMYYDHGSATSGASATNVWDTNYKAVWHLPNGSTLSATDSTSNGVNGTISGTTATTGQIYGSGNFNGTSNYISTSLDVDPTAMPTTTWEAWVYPTSNTGNRTVFSNDDGTFDRGVVSNYTATSFHIFTGSGTWIPVATTINTWQHIAVVYTPFNIFFYKNGVQYTYGAAPTTGTTVNNLHIGANPGFGEYFSGRIDEVRISNSQRHADWIEASYLTQNDAMNTFGDAETQSNPVKSFSESSIAIWDDDAPDPTEIAAGTTTTKALRILNEPAASTIATLAEADMQSFDADGFTLDWTTANASAMEILYWAAGTVVTMQEDYRWYKNTNAITPTDALEDENNPTTVARNNAETRLRMNLAVGGNGMNASTTSFKLQYASQLAEVGQTATNDWCDDNTGVTCTAAGDTKVVPRTDWCNDTTGVSCYAPTNDPTFTDTMQSDWCNDGTACNSNWSTRRSITFNNSASGTNLTEFPVLVKLNESSSRIDYSKTKANGEDIRFVDPANPNSVLPHEIESWNESGDSYVWVKVPQINTGTSDSIWMYYGNTAASDGQNVANVWDSGYVGVWHMHENPGGSAPQMQDSTTYNNDGTTTGTMTSGDSVAGKIYNSVDFDGSDDAINAQSDAELDDLTNITYSAWIDPTSFGDVTLGRIIDKGTDSSGWGAFVCNNGTNGTNTFCWYNGRPNTQDGWWNAPNSSISTSGGFYHTAATYNTSSNANDPTMYLNGTSVAVTESQAPTGTFASDAAFSVILGDRPAFNRSYSGLIDEVRLSNVIRSDDWIEAEYLSGNDAMNTYGSEESLGTASNSSDGWTDRKKISFDNSASTTNLTEFPVLVKLNSSRIDYSKTMSNGEDIRFVDPANPNVVLSHEIETWNESGDSYVWVEVPQVNNTTTDYIWMYYGNSAATDGQDPTGVWSNSYVGVYHMKETSGTTIDDPTTNNNNGTKVSASDPTSSTTGKINGAQTFDGSNDNVSVTNATSINFGASQDFTVGAWVKTTQAAALNTWPAFVSKEDGNATRAGYNLNLHNSNLNSGIWFFEVFIGGTAYTAFGTSNIADGKWHYVVGKRSGTSIISLEDGALANTTTNALLNGTTQKSIPLKFGSQAGNTNWYSGMIDEVRVSDIARSNDWINAEYKTMNDDMNSFGNAQSWEQQTNSGWQYRRKITFNNAASTENLTNFPVLVKLDSSRIDYDKTQDSGQDIRFVDPSNNTVVLAHEIESWDETGYSYVWVNVTQIDLGSKTDYIYMYYGNSTVSDGQAPSSVWDGNHKGVWHLPEDPAVAGTGGILDSTSNNNDGTDNGSMNAADQVTGKINGSIDFDGTDDYINVPHATSQQIVNGTFEAWVYHDAAGDYDFIMEKGSGSDVDNYSVLISNSNFIGFQFRDTGSTFRSYTDTTTIPVATWTHVIVTYDDTNNLINFYINGVLSSSQSATFSLQNTNTASLHFGVEDLSGLSAWHDGKIDELRISDTVRSAERVEAEYLSQTDRMNTFGDETVYTKAGAASVGWIDVGNQWCNASTSCNTSWAYRKRITIDNSGSSTNLTDFPILVKLNSSRIDYSKTQDDGDDIRFVDPADPTTILAHEIETWNESGDSYVWVKVPQLNAYSSYESLLLYYGNASASNGQAATSVWDSNTDAVWHLKQDPAVAGSNGILDSTSNLNHGTDNGSMNAADQVTGKINGSIDFDGSDDYIQAAHSTSLNNTSALTISAWVNLSGTMTDNLNRGIIEKTVGGVVNEQYLLFIEGGQAVIRVEKGDVWTDAYSNDIISVNTWHHIATSWDGSTLKLYVDGILQDDAPALTPSLDSGTGVTLIGGLGSSIYKMTGAIDEVRVSGVGRSNDWLKAEYLTQSDQMNTYGSEETQTSQVWKYGENASVADGTTITTKALFGSAAGTQMSYQESNPTIINPTAIAVGEKREWDFSLDGDLATPRRTYYFRMVSADGEPLTSYTRYAQITVGVPPEKLMRNGKWFNYKTKQPFTF